MTTSNLWQQLRTVAVVIAIFASAATVWAFPESPWALLPMALAAALAVINLVYQPLPLNEFKDALDLSGTGMLSTDTEGRIQTINSTLLRSLNVEPEQALGRTLDQFIATPVWQQILEHKADLEAGKSLALELDLHVGRRTHHLRGHGRLIRNVWGRARGYLIQVTDQTREHQTVRALSHTNDQLRRAFNQSSDLVFMLDGKLRATFLNQSVHNQLPIQAVSLHVTPFLACVDEDSRPAFKKGFDKHISPSTIL